MKKLSLILFVFIQSITISLSGQSLEDAVKEFDKKIMLKLCLYP